MEIHIADLHVFNERSRHTADNRWILGYRVEAGNVGDEYATKYARWDASRSTHSRAQAEKEGGVNYSAHGQICNRDVFDLRAIDALERKPPASIEDAVGDGDVLESAIGLGAALNSPDRLALLRVGRQLVCSAQHAAVFICAGNIAIRDSDIFCSSCMAQRKGTLRTDAVIPGRVDGAIGDAHIPTAVKINAIAIRVDLEAIDENVVHAGEQDCKMTSHQNRDVLDDDVAAVLQGDCLVTNAWAFCAGQLACVSAAQAFAPDETAACDG